MNKIIQILCLAVLLLCSCRESNLLDQIDGSPEKVQFRVNVELDVEKTKSAGNFGNGDKIRRFVLEAYAQGETKAELRLVQDIEKTDFDLLLTPDTKYDILVWADACSHLAKTEEVYNTENGLRAVSIIDQDPATSEVEVLGNSELRDAFCHSMEIETSYGMQPINILLKRPLAQLNISTKTEDVPKSYAPNYVELLYREAAYTEFNVETGEATQSKRIKWQTKMATKEAFVFEQAQHLVCDYLFSSYLENEKLGLALSIYRGEVATPFIEELEMSEIPLISNHQINIFGDLLFDDAAENVKISVTIDPNFSNSGFDLDLDGKDEGEGGDNEEGEKPDDDKVYDLLIEANNQGELSAALEKIYQENNWDKQTYRVGHAKITGEMNGDDFAALAVCLIEEVDLSEIHTIRTSSSSGDGNFIPSHAWFFAADTSASATLSRSKPGAEVLRIFHLPRCSPSIGEYAFSGCPQLEQFIVDEEVEGFDVDFAAFKDSAKLSQKSVDDILAKFNGRAYSGYMFSGNLQITEITLPVLPQDGMTERSVFEGCDNLKTVYCFADRLPILNGEAPESLLPSGFRKSSAQNDCLIYVKLGVDTEIWGYYFANILAVL